MDDNKTRRPINIVVYLMLCIFCLSSQIANNSLWVSLPVFTGHSPEGASLATYFVALLECANAAPVAYLIALRCTKHKLSEIPFIYGSFALGATSLLMAAIFWESHVQIMGNPSSFLLLICVFFASIVSAISRVTYAPFIARLLEGYVSAAMVGEILSAFIPIILGVGQGIGAEPNCTSILDPPVAQDNLTKTIYSRPAENHKTTLAPVLPPAKVRFPVYGFFLVMTTIFAFSIVCFLTLRCLRLFKTEYAVDNGGEGEGEPEFEESELVIHGCGIAPSSSEERGRGAERRLDHRGATSYSLDDGTIITIRQAAPLVGSDTDVKRTYYEQEQQEQQEPVSHHRDRHHQPHNSPHHLHPHHQQQQQQQQQQQIQNHHMNQRHNRPTTLQDVSRRPRFTSTGSAATRFSETASEPSVHPKNFKLLMVITLWTSSIVNGPLSPVLSYACYPIGNHAFLIGAILSHIIVLASSPIAIKLAKMSQITIVIALTALGTILLTYFTALISFSHSTQSHDSPVFGKNGELLATITWVAIVALFSFAKMTIGAVCRKAHRDSVLYFAVLSQAGAAIGTFSVLSKITICRVFQVNGGFSCHDE